MDQFVEKISLQDRSARSIEDYEKEGVFTGAYCINPLSGSRIPVYTANFALMEYGTGAVMSVPAHDQRDFDFAKKYGLDIVVVVNPEREELDGQTMTEAYAGQGSGAAFDHSILDGLLKEFVNEDGWVAVPHRCTVCPATRPERLGPRRPCCRERARIHLEPRPFQGPRIP